jgi:hypothetical protein
MPVPHNLSFALHRCQEDFPALRNASGRYEECARILLWFPNRRVAMRGVDLSIAECRLQISDLSSFLMTDQAGDNEHVSEGIAQ